MNLATTIASIPITILSFIVIAEINSWITLPTFWSISLFSAFFFYLIILPLRMIFIGRFRGVSPGLEGEDPAGVTRALIGMFFLLLFFGLGYFSLAKESASTAHITLIVPVLIGLLLGSALTFFEYSIFKYFKIEKVDSGITFHDITKYIKWYHYIAVLLFSLLFYVDFFTT